MDEQIMDTAGSRLYETLVRLRDLGVDLKWDNNEILHWYSTKGVALKSKSKFRDLPIAIVYLLRRNASKTITEGRRTLENIWDLETLRSKGMKKLCAQIDAFHFEKINWARQSKTMEAEIKLLKQKLHFSAGRLLWRCRFSSCGYKEAVINSNNVENYDQDDSEDEDITLITGCPVTQVDTDNEISTTSAVFATAESPLSVTQPAHLSLEARQSKPDESSSQNRHNRENPSMFQSSKQLQMRTMV